MKHDKVKTLYDFIDDLAHQGNCTFELDDDSKCVERIEHENTYFKYILVQAIGPRRQVYEEMEKTLEEIGIYPRCGILQVQQVFNDQDWITYYWS